MRTPLLVASVLVLAGCETPSSPGELLIQEMCTCKDKPCAERVSRQLTSYTESLRARAAAGSVPPELARLQRQEQRYYDCLGRALGEKIDGTIKVVMPLDAAPLDPP